MPTPSTSTPMFNAQLLGQTEKAANAILRRLLSGPGLTEPQWVTLAITAMSGGGDQHQLSQRVADGLKITEAEARARITALADAQLLHLPDDQQAPVKLTDAGQQLHTQIRATTAQITQRLWGASPPRTWQARAVS